MRLSRRLIVVFAVLGLTVVAQGATAQSLTGRLSGTVADDQGGVLPGADVTLTDQASKATQRTVTNAEGVFVFAAVPAGTYAIKVELSGFNSWEATDILLRLGESRSITGIQMKVGGLSETISVTSRPEIAPLESGEKSARLTSEQIDNVPMVGRSTAELLKLLPGMTPRSQGVSNEPSFNGEVIGINGNGEGGQQSAVGNYSANGNRVDSLDIVIDGAHAADPGCNCATSINPNPDMVGEFKVLQSNYGAEHAKGPVTIDVISKAGGRDFHGTGYYYFRDYRMNSNDWRFNEVGREKPKNKFGYPGFNIGGPVIIPGTDFNKNRDKMFFFTGYEFYRQRLDTGVLQSWVPTEAMINGDFSNVGSYSGLGGGQVPYVSNVPNNLVNGQVPASQIDPNAQALLRLLPRPNADPGVTGGYNYFEAVELDQNMHQWLTRVDYNVSDNTRIFARYNFQAETQNFPVGLWWRNGNQVPYPTSVTAPNRSHSSTLSLTKVFGATLTSESTFGLTYIDFPNQFEDPTKVSRSALGFNNPGIYQAGALNQIPSIASWGQGPTMFNPGGFDPVLFATKWLVSGTQNVTKVAGAHTLKMGAYYEWVQNNQPGNGNSNGVLVPGAWSPFTTGNAFSDLLTGTLNNYDEQSPNVLHDIAYHVFEGYIQDSWKMNSRLTLDGGLRISHLGGWYERGGQGFAVFDPSRYDPNAAASTFTGFTWTARDSAIPTTGVDVEPILWGPRIGAAYDLFGTGRTLLRGGYGVFHFHDQQSPYAAFVDLPYGVTNQSVPNIKLADVPNVNPNVTPGIGGSILITDDKQPRTQSWSGTIQQRLPFQMTLELGYVGSKSDRLANRGISNANFQPIGTLFGQASRRFPQYGDLSITEHSAYQNYHSLQTLLSRASTKFSYTVAYTWSKALGVWGDAQGAGGGSEISVPGNIRDQAYGVLGYDRAHVLNVGYSYLLPDLEGRGALMRGVLGGWQLTGVSTYVSGAPLQQLAPTSRNFNINGTAAGGATLSNTAWLGTEDIALMPVITCDPREGVSGDQILNSACFAIPPPGANGTYVFPTLRGPAYTNHDFAVFKNFSMGGARKFQFRASLTNVFNHPQRFFEDNNLRLTYENGVLTNQQFGVLPRDNKYGRRIVQLAFKYYF